MNIIEITLVVLVVIMGICQFWLFWKYRDTEVLALALLAYLRDNGGVPSYKDLSPYVRDAFLNRIDKGG